MAHPSEPYSPDQQQDSKIVGGPLAPDADPQWPTIAHTDRCGNTGGGGGPSISMDGVDISDMPWMLGSGVAFTNCPDTGCRMDNGGNFIGPLYFPNGWYTKDCTGSAANPSAGYNCGPFVLHGPGYDGYGLTGTNQDQYGIAPAAQASGTAAVAATPTPPPTA
jgi:hypothetical protein